MMSADIFIAHVAGHAGISVERTERVTRIVLSGLGSYLPPATRQWIADELPPPLRRMLEEASGAAAMIERRVLDAGDITAGRARELIASVCRVVAEALSTDAVIALRAAVPASFAALLVAPTPGLVTRPPESHHNPTLATGRPGSAHPISEAGPRTGQVGSVSEDNPHGETKLSSSPGMTQERRHETFAEGHPGYEHPLASPRRE